MPSAITLSSPLCLLSAVISKSGWLLLHSQNGISFTSLRVKKKALTLIFFQSVDPLCRSCKGCMLQYHVCLHNATFQQLRGRSATLLSTDSDVTGARRYAVEILFKEFQQSLKNILTSAIDTKMILELQIFRKSEVKTSSESATLTKGSSVWELRIHCMKTLLDMWDLRNPSSSKGALQYRWGVKIMGHTYLFARPRVELCNCARIKNVHEKRQTQRRRN